jgi:hypothetical protein
VSLPGEIAIIDANRFYSSHRFQQHTEMLFKITHTGTFNISIRALMLIYQVSAAKQVRTSQDKHTINPSNSSSVHRKRQTDSTEHYTNLCWTLDF